MISDSVTKYCCEDISTIENYNIAIKSKGVWHCHHKAELLPCGIFTADDLKKFNLYYFRPANELVFLPAKDHIMLHYNDKRTINRVSKHKTGRIWCNNGIIERQVFTIPDGFVKGRL